jgi:hypothetical protein
LKQASKHRPNAQTSTTSDDVRQEPEPNNVSSGFQLPESPIGSAYDLFVRSATEAATGQNGKATKAHNKRIRRLWPRLEPEQQATWVKLFNARPDDVPLVTKGKALLWSQDLLSKLLPNDSKAASTEQP